MNGLKESLAYFRENRDPPPVSQINIVVFFKEHGAEEYYVPWTTNDEEVEFVLATAYGHLAAARIRMEGSGESPIIQMYFNTDSITSYHINPEDLDNLPNFLNKVKFAIENYLGFYR